MFDPYKILGISRDATKNDIKKAYRKLAVEYHPDKGGDENKFKQVSEAYSILADENKKRKYEARQQEAQFGDVFSGFGDIFESFFGDHRRPNRRRSRHEQTDSQLMFDLKISLEQIKEGVVNSIVFERDKKCKKCDGKGGQTKKMCALCRGTGMEAFRSGNIFQHVTCRNCHGEGSTFNVRCDHCSGAGVMRVKESITLEIKEVR